MQKREGQAQLVRRPKRDLKTARIDFSVLNVTFILESLLRLKGDPFRAKYEILLVGFGSARFSPSPKLRRGVTKRCYATQQRSCSG